MTLALRTLALKGSVLAAVCCTAVLPGVANAQTACREGKAASGQCVNGGLAEMTRQMAIIFSQPKISYTAYPVMPAADVRYRYPNELNPDPLKPSKIGTPAPN